MSKLTLYRLNGGNYYDAGIPNVLYPNEQLREVRLKEIKQARLFVIQSHPKIPDWIDYLTPIIQTPPDLTPTGTMGAVLLVKPHKRQPVLYAVTWGTGHFLIKPEMVQDNLGLLCALNMMCANDPDPAFWKAARLRALRTKRIGANTLIMESQYARLATLEAFPFNTDADQLRTVTGEPMDTDIWGKTVTGGVSLHIKSPKSPRLIIKICQDVEQIFLSDRYRYYFSWIDNIKAVGDIDLVAKLNKEITRRLKYGELEGLTLAPPALMDWSKIHTFEFHVDGIHERVEEPTLEGFRRLLKSKKILKKLNEHVLFREADLVALDEDGEKIASWYAGSCITGEFQYGQFNYIIDDGSYFAINKDFLEHLNTYIDSLKNFNKRLPHANPDLLEDRYIEMLAAKFPNALPLHKATVIRRGATSVEICDVALEDQKLIHVKRGKSSDALSHLFSQAVVSAELLYMDANFRKQVEHRLSGVFKVADGYDLGAYKWLYTSKYKPSGCEVVMAIMTGCKRKPLSALLPFFSKINLRMRCEDLRKMGYSYSIAQVTPYCRK